MGCSSSKVAAQVVEPAKPNPIWVWWDADLSDLAEHRARMGPVGDNFEESIENLASRLPCAGPFSSAPSEEQKVPSKQCSAPSAAGFVRLGRGDSIAAPWLRDDPSWRWWNLDLQDYMIDLRANGRAYSTSNPKQPEVEVEAESASRELWPRDEAWTWWDDKLEAYVHELRGRPAEPADVHELRGRPAEPDAFAAPPAPMEEPPTLRPDALCATLPLLRRAVTSPDHAMALSPGALEAELDLEEEGGEDSSMGWARLATVNRGLQQHLRSLAGGLPLEEEDKEAAQVPARRLAARGEVFTAPPEEPPARDACSEQPLRLAVAEAASPGAGRPPLPQVAGPIPSLLLHLAGPLPPLPAAAQALDAVAAAVAAAQPMEAASPPPVAEQEAEDAQHLGPDVLLARMDQMQGTLDELARLLAAREEASRVQGSPPPSRDEGAAPLPPEDPRPWDDEGPTSDHLQRQLCGMASFVEHLMSMRDVSSESPLRLAAAEAASHDAGRPPALQVAGPMPPLMHLAGPLPPLPVAAPALDAVAAALPMQVSAMPEGAQPPDVHGDELPRPTASGGHIRVTLASAAPAGTVLSLRVAEVRRQVSVAVLGQQGLRLRVQAGPRDMSVKAFRTVASGSFVLHPGKAVYEVTLRGEDFSRAARIAVVRLRGVFDPVDSPQAYFQEHRGLQQYITALFQAAILERAADPFAFMEARVQECLGASAADADAAEGAGAGAELRLDLGESLPDNYVVAVRLGNERKQARASTLRESSLCFSTGALAPLEIAILAPMARKQVRLTEGIEEPILLQLATGDSPLDVLLHREPEHAAMYREDALTEVSQPEHEVDSEEYSLRHGLVEACCTMCLRLINEQPEDPFPFMLSYMQERRAPEAG